MVLQTASNNLHSYLKEIFTGFHLILESSKRLLKGNSLIFVASVVSFCTPHKKTGQSFRADTQSIIMSSRFGRIIRDLESINNSLAPKALKSLN